MLVFGFVLAAGTVIGLITIERYKRSAKQLDDVFVAFAYFLEDHGRLPSSQDEFLRSGVFETLPDGRLRVPARPHSRFRPKTYGEPIASLDAYQPTYGIDLGKLHVDRDGGVRDAERREYLVVREGTGVNALRYFTVDLLRIYERLHRKPAAASQPAGGQP